MTLTFAHSERSSLGIEWELQLVDENSRDLRQAADTILQRAGLDSERAARENIHREMFLNTIEVTSLPRSSVSRCLADLTEAIDFLSPFARELGIDLVSAGTHPFARPSRQIVTGSDRYTRLVERTRHWGRQMLLYGVHVHVGIEDRRKVLPIQDALVAHLGHLQAIAASSPFWSGEDTAYASNRAMLFQQLPAAGIPRRFSTWNDLEAYADGMIRAGAISVFDEVRWDIRPSPRLGTIEVRAFDSATNLAEVGAFAALTHCLVEDFSRRLDAGLALPAIPDWFIAENKWRTARYGLEADLITDESGGSIGARAAIDDLVDRLRPIADDLDCAGELDSIAQIMTIGASYERQRVVAARAGVDAVVDLMRAEMSLGRPIAPREFLTRRRDT
ncbi:glutamate--cysteine ligase [Actinomyces sp. B33]|uniref:glutamate--cysteine ligase n=1 Tax=Actinomyces sp. B33 TaxID=2942131 RepID=UPI0023402BF6|nr:glutamate--cysteine ligase [Actinomyces sp. B33]MDC4233638.1 glutamate--cysteine ligase [Actinomyces sp. B33]